MAGEAGLDGDLRGLEVADFTDQDHVRVLTEEAAQQLRERQLLVVVDAALDETVDVILDGVFGGEDLDRRIVDRLQRGVERGRLARSGRSRDEHDAVGLVDEHVHLRPVVVAQADAIERQLHVAPVEHTHHDALAVHGGEHGDAEIDRIPVDVHLDAAVLGQAALGDVELRQHLDARDDGHRQLLGRRREFIQHAIDAVAHPELVLERLHVDVAGLVPDRIHQVPVDQTHDRVVVGRGFGGRQVEAVTAPGHAGNRALGCRLEEDILVSRSAGQPREVILDELVHLLSRCDDTHDLDAGQERARRVQRREVAGALDGKRDGLSAALVRLDPDGQDAEVLHGLCRQRRQQV